MAKSFDDTFANEWNDKFWKKMKGKGFDEFDFISIGGVSVNKLMPPGIRKLPRDVQREFLKSLLISNLVRHLETVEIATFGVGGAYHFRPVDIDFSDIAEMSEPIEAKNSGGLLTRLGLGGKGHPAARFKSDIPDEAEQKELEQAIKAGVMTAEQSERAKILKAHRVIAEADEKEKTHLTMNELEHQVTYANDMSEATQSMKKKPRVMVPKQ